MTRVSVYSTALVAFVAGTPSFSVSLTSKLTTICSDCHDLHIHIHPELDILGR